MRISRDDRERGRVDNRREKNRVRNMRKIRKRKKRKGRRAYGLRGMDIEEREGRGK